jgi:para-nitrobenzyl esterase
LKLEVETCYGRVRGRESGGVRIFRGVRYATPPSGVRRFLPPLPPEPWTGTFDATRPGPAAPQFALSWFGWVSAAGVAPGEDCLSLNIWTPGLDAAKRPVLVWIHGGGFLVGAGSTPVYDGRSLASRGVVVVTLNYRLGALGFAHLGLLYPGELPHCSNLGVRDQIAALAWIRQNIERFGGDPENVTVCGQSAGAMSVGALLGAPSARGLFQRAICQSGAADHVLEPGEARAVARVFLEQLGRPRPSFEALGQLPLQRILRAQRSALMRLMDWTRIMVFLPAVDGDLIPEQPLDAIRRGATAQIPILLGTTLDEWRLFRIVDEGPFAMREEELLARFARTLRAGFPAAPGPERAVREFRGAIEARGARARPGDVWCEFQSARVMHFPAARLAEAQSGGGGSAHAYLFTWRPPALRRAIGACHALDIPFVFGSIQHPLARPLTGLAGSAAHLSRKIQQAWVEFARGGEPCHSELPPWERYDDERRATMVLGRRCALDDAPLEPERRLLAAWRGDPPTAQAKPSWARRARAS